MIALGIDVIVLGGGKLKENFSDDFSITSKACLDINGKPMVEYVLDALRGCSDVGRIVLIGTDSFKDRWTKKVDKTLVGKGTLTENLFAGVDFLKTKEPILLVSADVPLITSEAISDFLKRCFEMDGEAFYPIIPKICIESKFPEVRRTYFELKEGIFTGGNLGLAYPCVFKENKELIERIYSLRKNPVKLVQMLGLWFVLKFLTHSLTITDAEKNASRILKAQGRAVVTPYCEIGIDVDKKSDLELVRKILS